MGMRSTQVMLLSGLPPQSLAVCLIALKATQDLIQTVLVQVNTFCKTDETTPEDRRGSQSVVKQVFLQHHTQGFTEQVQVHLLLISKTTLFLSQAAIHDADKLSCLLVSLQYSLFI